MIGVAIIIHYPVLGKSLAPDGEEIPQRERRIIIGLYVNRSARVVRVDYPLAIRGEANAGRYRDALAVNDDREMRIDAVLLRRRIQETRAWHFVDGRDSRIRA